MRIAFLGSNEKEVQALNSYFFNLYKPKEDLVGVIKTKCSYEYRYKNGNLVIIRIMQENVKGYKFDKIYYMDTIDSYFMNYIYCCLFPMCKTRGNVIRLRTEDLKIKFNE